MLRVCQRDEYWFKTLKTGWYFSRVKRSEGVLWREHREIYNGSWPERASHSSMRVARRSNVLLGMSESEACDMSGRSIFIDDQSSGVPTTVLLQSLQTDDSSIGTCKFPVVVRSVLANSDIVAMISGGIMRMNGLWVRFMFRFSSHRFIFSLAMASSRFASSMQELQGELLEHEMLHSAPCRSPTVTSELSQCLQTIVPK